MLAAARYPGEYEHEFVERLRLESTEDLDEPG